jgi:hypothetical protein
LQPPSQAQKNGEWEILRQELNKKKAAWCMGGEADHLFLAAF